MSAPDPDEVTAIGVPVEPAVGDDLLERVAWLDLSDALDRFVRGVDPDTPYYVAYHIGIEYRRFLLLRLTYPQLNIPAPPLLDKCWRLHAADRSKFAADCASLVAGTDLNPDALAPPPTPSEPPGQQIRDLYQAMFPCGDADLWGWPPLEHNHRISAPDLGCVHIRLPTALDESTRDALRQEALAQRESATELKSLKRRIERGAVSGGFGHYCSTSAGPVLHEVHRNGSIPRLIAAQTGAIVVPNGAFYNYYRSGDFISLHTDPRSAELVLLTLLSGPIEPLYGHLELADTPLEEIQSLALATGGLPEGGTPFEITSVPLLFSGQRIPHHRNPTERHEEVVVLLQFFGSLLPSRSATRKSEAVTIADAAPKTIDHQESGRTGQRPEFASKRSGGHR